MFLNRALSDPYLFYTMVNCHLLKYDVCRVIEKRLNSMADQKIKSYGLAFIYAKEEKDSRIKAYLDKYLVKDSPIVDDLHLQKYVKGILTISNHSKSACCVDKDR